MQEKLACDFVQAFGQRRRKLFGIGARIFTMDRAYRIDVLVDQFKRDAGRIGRVLDQPAKALSHGCDGRVPERRRFTLDVVRGVKERVCFGPGGILGESAAGLSSRSHSESIQLPNSQDSSASAFSARATGSSCGSPAVFVDTAPRSLFSGEITS